MAVVLTLVRHGQSAANARGVMCGRSDPPLTDTGRRQARALASGLPRPTRLLSSPLARARETAALLGADVPVEIDARWTEMDYGALDGQPMTALDGDAWRTWQADPRIRAAFQYTLRDDPIFPTGLADIALTRLHPAYEAWRTRGREC